MVYAALGAGIANLWWCKILWYVRTRSTQHLSQEQGGTGSQTCFSLIHARTSLIPLLFWLLSPSGVSTRTQVAWMPIKITASKLEPAHRNSNREGKEEPAANEHAGTPETLRQLMPAYARRGDP